MSDEEKAQSIKQTLIRPDKRAVREKVDYLNELCDHIPNGLRELNDAVSMAIFDLVSYYRFDMKLSTLDKALKFANSIPVFESFDSDAFNHWLLNSTEYHDYYNK